MDFKNLRIQEFCNGRVNIFFKFLVLLILINYVYFIFKKTLFF